MNFDRFKKLTQEQIIGLTTVAGLIVAGLVSAWVSGETHQPVPEVLEDPLPPLPEPLTDPLGGSDETQ